MASHSHSHSFTVKRKAVPPLLPSDHTTPQPTFKQARPTAVHHTISLPNFHARTPHSPSPKKRKPFSLKKMLSFTRLNVSKEQSLIPSLPPIRHSNIGACWQRPDLSPPSSPTPPSALSRPSSPLSALRISTSSSTLTASSRRASTDHGNRANDSPRIQTAAELADLASPASQHSALTSWYDSWFETQSLLEQQRQQDALRDQPQPVSFFEDDSDEEDREADDEFTTDTESDFASILPDCAQSDSDEDTDIEDIDEGDITLTIGRRVICRRVSCHLFSAEDSQSDSSLRNRRAFELERTSNDY